MVRSRTADVAELLADLEAVVGRAHLLTEPAENVNWVFGPGGSPQHTVDRRLYLLLVMALYPLAFHLPADMMFDRLFPPPRTDAVTMDLGSGKEP